MNKNMLYRSIPKVDVLLENSDIVTLIENHHRDVVVDVIREEIDKLRNFIKENDDGSIFCKLPIKALKLSIIERELSEEKREELSKSFKERIYGGN